MVGVITVLYTIISLLVRDSRTGSRMVVGSSKVRHNM
jgi:hypothetical protein